MKNNDILSDVLHLPTHSLTIHPDIEAFPGHSDDQLAALDLSVKAQGILVPLIADEEYRVYAGRARLAIAMATEMPEVPVIIRREANILGYAIEDAINRRQLTRSAIALVLFEQHPELALFRNKGGRPSKKPVVEPQVSSFAALAHRYRVPRDYLSHLLSMHTGMSAEEWAELRRVVLFEEASVPRQFAGFSTGLPVGSSRGAVIYAAVDAQGLLEGILPRAFSSIRQGFARWGSEIDSKAKAAVEKEWADLLDAAPPELIKIAKRKAAQNG